MIPFATSVTLPVVSVKEDNVKELLRQDNIDGALIGGASLKYEHFNKIIEIAELINI